MRHAVRTVRMGLFVALVLFAGTSVMAQDLELRGLTLDTQVIASDPEATSMALAEWADRSGGYYTFRSAERVELRVPTAAATQVREIIESLGDELVLYAPSTIDYRDELRDVEAGIVSRTESLERVLAYLEEANVSATLAFERELRSLNQEIEHFEGRRRAIINHARFARVTVRLSVRSRSVPAQLPSSFPWINTISVYRFIDRLNQEGRR